VPVSNGPDLLFVALPYTMGPARVSHSTILQIIDDNLGFLWFGTEDGLKRYDGYRFQDFRPNLKVPTTVSGISIGALFRDHSGRLWVTADRHLDRYDPATEIFTHLSEPGGPDLPVNSINEDRAGIVWLATDHGLNRVDPTTGQVTRFRHEPGDPYSLSSNLLRSTFEQQDGTFWVASEAGLDVFNRALGKVTRRYSFGPSISNQPPQRERSASSGSIGRALGRFSARRIGHC
jgi:ligand-binding sensor domain-containing protein